MHLGLGTHPNIEFREQQGRGHVEEGLHEDLGCAGLSAGRAKGTWHRGVWHTQWRQHATEDGKGSRGLLVELPEGGAGQLLQVVGELV